MPFKGEKPYSAGNTAELLPVNVRSIRQNAPMGLLSLLSMSLQTLIFVERRLIILYHSDNPCKGFLALFLRRHSPV